MVKNSLISLWKAMFPRDKKYWLKALKYAGILFGIEMVSLTAGIGIWLIVHGIWIATSRLFIYYGPARRFILANVFHSQDEQYLQTPPMLWHRWIILFIYLVLVSFFLFAGINILVQNGFLEQNIIYMIHPS